MWHRRRRRRLGLVRAPRKALLAHLVCGLVEHQRIRTTYARAKETARFADHLVTVAKRGDLHARRQIIRRLRSPDAAKRLIEEIAPQFKDRQGGYTRVLKWKSRPGDGADLGIIEFTQILEAPSKKEKKEKKKQEKLPREEKKKEPPKEKEKKKPPKAEKEERRKQEKGEAKEPEKPTPVKEEEKKGGFLTNLRKFLKGD